MSVDRTAIAYQSSELNDLDALQLTCERDEGQLNAMLISLMTGTVDGVNGDDPVEATIAVYKYLGLPYPPNAYPGTLTFVEFQLGDDVKRIITDQYNNKGNRHLFTGSALIGSSTKSIMVFKPK